MASFTGSAIRQSTGLVAGITVMAGSELSVSEFSSL
jgi:hypothetical protein